jgi:hypothetical protein
VKAGRRSLAILAATGAAALLAPSALLAPTVSSGYIVGIGEQSPAFFSDPYLTALAPARTRYITPIDSIFRGRATLDAWMTAAREADMEVVVAFNPPARMRCPNLGRARGCRPIPAARFRAAFRAFHRTYPWVRIVQPWNEVNNVTQPTAHHPEAVVAYYRIVRSVCPGCTVLGADIQDLPNMVPYTNTLLEDFRAAHVRTPRLWGLHNYTDTNRFVRDRNSSMRKAAALLPGRIWLTETAGLFRFQPQNARQSFRPDLARQRRAMQAIFAQATRYRRKVDRIYLYEWFAPAPSNRWDSGILDARGRPRPVYAVLEQHRLAFR